MTDQVTVAYDGAKMKELIEAKPRQPRGGAAYRHLFKRAFDIILVLAALPALIAVLLPLMALIALDGRSPIYVQKRIGRTGRVFRMFKLRSMVAGADRILEDYLDSNPEARAEWDRDQKLKSDPRITFFGRFIRKTSLDELPQLFNVLIGDMSIVGPRPMMVEQRDIYPGAAYYDMRPGITGYWQVSERNESSFAERADFDNRYFRDMSLGTDMSVLMATVAVVVKGTGY